MASWTSVSEIPVRSNLSGLIIQFDLGVFAAAVMNSASSLKKENSFWHTPLFLIRSTTSRVVTEPGFVIL